MDARRAVLGVVLLLPAGAMAGEGIDSRLRDRTDKALAKAHAFLARNQGSDGDWLGDPGLTAHVAYALHSSLGGRSRSEVDRAVGWMARHPWRYGPGWLGSTQAAALQVLVLAGVDGKRYRGRIHELCDHLVRAQAEQGPWDGNLVPNRDADYRLPNYPTWHAALALWTAATTVRYRVPQETWGRLSDHYARSQLDSGAWGPEPRVGVGQHNAALARTWISPLGLSTYVVSTAAASRGSWSSVCETEPAQRGTAFVRANWPSEGAIWRLTHSFSRVVEPLECAIVVGGLPARHAYATAARRMMRAQRSDGSWGNGRTARDRVSATSAAVVFLGRASRQLPSDATAMPASATVTEPDRFPTPTRARELASAFDCYRRYPPERQRRVMHAFGPLGKPALAFLVSKLEDSDEQARATALHLLGILTLQPLVFDPRGAPPQRAQQVAAIRTQLGTEWGGLVWSERFRRFLPPR
jgi:hypothetical protein